MSRHAIRILAATALGATMLVAGCSLMGEGSPEPTSAASVQYASNAAALGMPTASPESNGFSTAGIDALKAEWRGMVDQQKLAGVTTLLARHGKVVYFDTYGKADLMTGADLHPDSIFRIASMTKPTIG